MQGDVSAGGGRKPDDGAGDGGLAATALAHDTERLADTHLEVDAVDGTDDALGRFEVHLGVPGLDQRAHLCRSGAARADCFGGLAQILARRGHDAPSQARRQVIRRHGDERRALLFAVVLPEAAARCEDAARRQLVHTRNGPGNGHQRAFLRRGVEAGHAAEQVQRVRVLRPHEQFTQLGLLHELAGIHDANTIADLRDHAEVVRDVEDRRVELPLELGDEVEHHGLRGDVEGRRRLVHDEQ